MHLPHLTDYAKSPIVFSQWWHYIFIYSSLFTISGRKYKQTNIGLTCESPFPSNRHHRSNGDCLEGKRENYQVCSVQYCVQQLYTVNCTHIWTELTVLWIGFCLSGPISLCLDSFLCMYYFVCSIVTWWGGPGGIEAWSLGPLLQFLQCFDTVGWVIWPVKPVHDMTYNVFSGTLNPTQSINQSTYMWTKYTL